MTSIRPNQAAGFAKRKDALRAAIRSDKSLTFAEKCVGLRLVELIHAERQCAWPSAPTLANDVGCSARTVWSAIKKLDGRHFDRELSGPGGHNRYFPRWPDEQEHTEAPVKQASYPREAAFMPPVKQASYKIVELDPYLDPDFSDGDKLKKDQQSSDVIVEGYSAPTEEAEPFEPFARREEETVSTAEADPDTPSLAAQAKATFKFKEHHVDLTVDSLVQGYVKARQRERRMSRDPGPVDIGFDRYVCRAIETHCNENREARLRQLDEVFGKDTARRPVRSRSRALLDARINQKRGNTEADASPT